MSGLNFTIPGTLLAGLYKDTLIASEAHTPVTEKPVPAVAAQEPLKPVPTAVAAEPSRPVPAPVATETARPAPPPPVKTPAEPATSARKPFLGDNAKGILLIVKDENNVHLAEDSLQLLTGILAACRLNMGDVGVMNIARNTTSFAQLRQQTQVNYCFLFGVGLEEMELAFAIPQYQVFAHNSCTFLSVPAITSMLGPSEEAKLLKSKLWVCLKKIFNV
jgi:hypothetical protein